jgi:hypothetical protein
MTKEQKIKWLLGQMLLMVANAQFLLEASELVQDMQAQIGREEHEYEMYRAILLDYLPDMQAKDFRELLIDFHDAVLSDAQMPSEFTVGGANEQIAADIVKLRNYIEKQIFNNN